MWKYLSFLDIFNVDLHGTGNGIEWTRNHIKIYKVKNLPKMSTLSFCFLEKPSIRIDRKSFNEFVLYHSIS